MEDGKKKICLANEMKPMPMETKIKLCSLWISRIRSEEMRTLDLLLQLDDIWDESYNKSRIEFGFMAAKMIANEQVLNSIFNNQNNNNK